MKKIYPLLILTFLAMALNCVLFIQNAHCDVTFRLNWAKICKEEIYQRIQSTDNETAKFRTKNPKKKLDLLIKRYGKQLIRNFIKEHGDSQTVLLVDGEYILKDGRHQLEYHTAETFLMDIKRNGWDVRKFDRKIINWIKKEMTSYYDKGFEYLQIGNPAKAAFMFHRMLDYDPNFAPAYCGAGVAYIAWKKPQKAIAEFKKALELDPELYFAYFAQGVEYFQLEEYQSAIENLTRAIELRKNDENALFIRGMANRDLNKIEQSIGDFTNVIAINNSNDIAYYSRALLKKKIKDTKGAIEDLNEAYRLNPQKIDYATLLSEYEKDLLVETNSEISGEVKSGENEGFDDIFEDERPIIYGNTPETEEIFKE